MQPHIFTLLELSKRVNGYKHMHVIHAALWDKAGESISFTPLEGNFGGTEVKAGTQAQGGSIKMLTHRVDDLIKAKEIFFAKIDAENVEMKVVLGMESYFDRKAIHHIVSAVSTILIWIYKYMRVPLYI